MEKRRFKELIKNLGNLTFNWKVSKAFGEKKEMKNMVEWCKWKRERVIVRVHLATI